VLSGHMVLRISPQALDGLNAWQVGRSVDELVLE
jgi:hypothetical protein